MRCRQAPLWAANDPTRPPDWRWRVAVDLVESGRPTPRAADATTVLLTDYLRLRRLCSASAAARRCAEQSNDLHSAVSLQEALVVSARIILEARFLAREPVQLIAESVGMSLAAVAWYHDCFYDVSDRLSQHDFVFANLIFGSPAQPLSHTSEEAALKLLAYLGGANVLNDFLLVTRPTKRDDLASVLARVGSSTHAFVELLAHCDIRRGGQPTARHAPLSAYAVRRSLDRQAENPQSDFEANVQAVLDGIKFRVGPIKLDDYPPALRPYIEQGWELRADEEAWLVAGGKLPYGPDLLAARVPQGGSEEGHEGAIENDEPHAP